MLLMHIFPVIMGIIGGIGIGFWIGFRVGSFSDYKDK